jgi:hypothetical protein
VASQAAVALDVEEDAVDRRLHPSAQALVGLPVPVREAVAAGNARREKRTKVRREADLQAQLDGVELVVGETRVDVAALCAQAVQGGGPGAHSFSSVKFA